jgi:glycerol-3-phosphate dehydrogenase (NAD(P)+)
MSAAAIAVLGGGAWATALAIAIARHAPVSLWIRDPAVAAGLEAQRENRRYLPGAQLPPRIQITSTLDDAVAGADLALFAAPVAALANVLGALSDLPPRPLIWACKGLDAAGRFPHAIAAAQLPPQVARGVLSGPSFAREVAAGQPAALTLAAADLSFARHAARCIGDRLLRVYPSDDVIGVEVGGAVKNVLAIAAGVCDGLELGANARAAVITRGLAEIMRLGAALGARRETLMGLSGVGDLILTCTGDLSRNRQVGLRLARGETIEVILGNLGHVAEGVATARALAAMAQAHAVEMPISAAVAAILFAHLSPRDAVAGLLARDVQGEFT